MFFWGSYNFQAPQLSEHPERPPLRFPAYMPPAPSAVMGRGGAEEEEILRRMDERRVAVKLVACGQKHLVAAVRVVEHTHNAANETANEDSAGWVVCGMGSNHSGQLGDRVPEYTTTLTDLHFEELLSSGTTVSSIACGNKHTLIATSSGSVFAAGDNSCDQLGVTVKLNGFAPVGGLARIKTVYAAGNVSFALDDKGQLYAWGEAQYGHLCNGDNGERLDPRSLKVVKTNVKVPTLAQWFVRHHVVIVEVAVARAHLVCRTNDEVYTCGEGTYGKLGNGSLATSFIPHRVQFPQRAYPERLCGIAAGDDHTLVLRESPVVGAVVYHFGKINHEDGQFTPTIVSAPANIVRIGAGRGTTSTAVTSDGLLYVWGKHACAGVSNGTPADSKRSAPQMVAALNKFFITDVVVGGTFVVACAASRRPVEELATQLSAGGDVNGERDGCSEHRWDVVVPHDARVRQVALKNATDKYEASVRAFLTQYIGPTLATRYIAKIPEAPPLTDLYADAFVPIRTNAIAVGQKVRLWMTDVYALGTITGVMAPNNTSNNEERVKVEKSPDTTNGRNGVHHHTNRLDHGQAEEDATIERNTKRGCRFRIEWQRDDWHDEEITLYSDDETLDEENPNRWQPLWFLLNPHNKGEYILDK